MITISSDSCLIEDFSNCDYCVTDDRCGFCAPSGPGTANGYCLPMNKEHEDSASSTGFCALGLHDKDYNSMNRQQKVQDDENETQSVDHATNNIHNAMYNTFNNTSYEWGDVYCHTKYTALPIVIMVVYLLFFASGKDLLPSFSLILR